MHPEVNAVSMAPRVKPELILPVMYVSESLTSPSLPHRYVERKHTLKTCCLVKIIPCIPILVLICIICLGDIVCSINSITLGMIEEGTDEIPYVGKFCMQTNFVKKLILAEGSFKNQVNQNEFI